MARRIIVMPPADVSPGGEGDGAFDNPYLPGRGLLQESVFSALIIFLTGEVILFGVAYLAMPWMDALRFSLAAAPVMAALAASIALGLAMYRVLRFERREKRYMALLDARVEAVWRELEAREEQGAVGREEALTADDRRWSQIAYEMLRRYYETLARTRNHEAAARAISRDACVKAGLCTQKEWNIVNQLLVRRGIRRGRKRGLVPRTFEEAWAIWQRAQAEVSGWYVEDGMWIPKE